MSLIKLLVLSCCLLSFSVPSYGMEYFRGLFNRQSCNETFLLAMASDNDEETILKTMKDALANGAKIQANDLKRNTAFHLSASGGFSKIIAFLCDKYKTDSFNLIDFLNIAGETPLYYAVIKNHFNCVKVLLKNGADISQKTKSGFSMLHLAAYRGYCDIIEYLVEFGAEIDNQTSSKFRNETPLHLAAAKGFEGTVKKLINLGADANAQNTDGDTSLHLAAKAGKIKVIRTLILTGADAAIKNNEGKTPSEVAKDDETKKSFKTAKKTKNRKKGKSRRTGKTKLIEVCVPISAPSSPRNKEKKKDLVLDDNIQFTRSLPTTPRGLSSAERIEQAGNVWLAEIKKKQKKEEELKRKKEEERELKEAKNKKQLQDETLLSSSFLLKLKSVFNPVLQEDEIILDRNKNVKIEGKELIKKIFKIRSLEIVKSIVSLEDSDKRTALHYIALSQKNDVSVYIKKLLKKGANPLQMDSHGEIPFQSVYRIYKLGIISPNEALARLNAFLKKVSGDDVKKQIKVVANDVLLWEEHGNRTKSAEETTKLEEEERSRRISEEAVAIVAAENCEKLKKKQLYEIRQKLLAGFLPRLKIFTKMKSFEHERCEVGSFINLFGSEIIDLHDENKNNALHLLANDTDESHVSLIDLLLQKGVDAAKQNSDGETPLYLATLQGNRAAMKHLVKKSTVNITDKNGDTPLHCAVLWAAHQKDANEKGEKVSTHKIPNMLKILLRSGADVTKKNNDGASAVRLAIHHKLEWIIYIFAKHQANVCMKQKFTEDRYSFLHYCAGAGYAKSVYQCFEKEPGLVKNYMYDSENFKEVTPLHLAIIEDKKDTIKYIVRVFDEKKLKFNWILKDCLKNGDHGLNVLNLNYNEEDKENTDLHHLASTGKFEKIEQILRAKNKFNFSGTRVDINAKNSLERTPLHLAAIAGWIKTVESLLRDEADMSAKDVYGLTPWHYANVLYDNQSEITQSLNRAWRKEKGLDGRCDKQFLRRKRY